MNWRDWLNWINREKLIFLITSLVLLQGYLFPWYSLPQNTLETFDIDLSLPNNIGKILAAILAIISIAFTLLISPSRIPRCPFLIGLFITLLFPYFIMTWFPPVAFTATAYHEQKLEVVKHVNLNFSHVQAQWKQNISLSQAIPINSVFNLIINDSRFFQISSWDKLLLNGFGYNNNFFEFIGTGWCLTTVGIVIGLTSIYLVSTKDPFRIFIRDMSIVLPWLCLIVSIIILFMIIPNIINHQLDTHLAKGEYQQVVSKSQVWGSRYPSLEGDTDFLLRTAEAGFYDDKPDTFLIYFAKGVESYRLGNFKKAANFFDKSLTIKPKHYLVRGYLATSLLNLGVENFNNHKPGSAAELFEQVLLIFPSHVEALYDLMIARVVNGDFEKSALVAQEIIEKQKYFQLPSIGLLGQAYLHSAWDSYHQEDLTKAWEQYRQSIDKSAWK